MGNRAFYVGLVLSLGFFGGVFQLLCRSPGQARVPATEPSTRPWPYPSFEVTPRQAGESRRIRYTDGREAEYRVYGPASVGITLPLTFVESTCEDVRSLPGCEFEAQVTVSRHQWVWTRNPDPARVGQPLKRVSRREYRDPESEVSFESDLDTATATLDIPALFFEREVSALPLEVRPWVRLRCDGLPPGRQALEGGVRRLYWEALDFESTLQNPDTGVEENRTTSSAFELLWSEREPGIWTLENLEGVETSFSFVDFLSIGTFIPIQASRWHVRYAASHGGTSTGPQVCALSAGLPAGGMQIAAQATPHLAGQTQTYRIGTYPLLERDESLLQSLTTIEDGVSYPMEVR